MSGKIKGFVKHFAVAGVVALGFTSHVVFADDVELTEVYHVYVDSEHAGIVDNKELVEDYISDTISQHQEGLYIYSKWRNYLCNRASIFF